MRKDSDELLNCRWKCKGIGSSTTIRLLPPDSSHLHNIDTASLKIEAFNVFEVLDCHAIASVGSPYLPDGISD